MIATANIYLNIQLTKQAHGDGRTFASKQCSQEKAKQVYLNTLAVYAVRSFLEWLNIETDLAAGDSWNSVIRLFNDVADLVIPNLGKLECRPVLPGETVITLPPEVTEDRICYIAVQFQEQLNEVQLLGFMPALDPEEPLSQIEIANLQPIENLIDYLDRLESAQDFLHSDDEVAVSELGGKNSLTQSDDPGNTPEVLRQWLEGIFRQDWQPKEAVFATSRRGPEQSPEVSRVKLIDLESHVVALFVSVLLESENELSIYLRLYPVGSAIYLPQGVQLIAVDDESGEIISQAQAEEVHNWIQINFKGENQGDRFSVKVGLGDISITEFFTI